MIDTFRTKITNFFQQITDLFSKEFPYYLEKMVLGFKDKDKKITLLSVLQA